MQTEYKVLAQKNTTEDRNMKEKKTERTEEKKTGYKESNIRMIRKIKSEDSQKRINMLVTHCYLKEADS